MNHGSPGSSGSIKNSYPVASEAFWRPSAISCHDGYSPPQRKKVLGDGHAELTSSTKDNRGLHRRNEAQSYGRNNPVPALGISKSVATSKANRGRPARAATPSRWPAHNYNRVLAQPGGPPRRRGVCRRHRRRPGGRHSPKDHEIASALPISGSLTPNQPTSIVPTVRDAHSCLSRTSSAVEAASLPNFMACAWRISTFVAVGAFARIGIVR